MYKKILVPLDGSPLAEQILPYVRLLAGTDNVSVELFWVNDVDLAERPPRSGREYLERAAERHLASLKQVESMEADGKAAEMIVRRASAEPDCLIAMATHGMSGMRRWLIGSVASKITQSAKNPLLLVRPRENADPSAAAGLKTIFVPLDGSGLAENALRHALPLAKQRKLALQLLRAYQVPAETFVVADGAIAEGSTELRDRVQREAQSYLDGKVETIRAEGLRDVIGTALPGDAASEIVDIAAKTANSLIVMSTHGRSGVGRWLLGSVAEKVVHHSHAPVLLVRAG